ncbi:MAG: hypothetical protein DRH37_09825 [Deltaproteobacteria bacterium]|nr:MAG: hypothetical protein DRH37_09825 [Deltaproteobacteria bacterium]
MKKKTEQIPAFKTEDEEREFWATHSPLDFMDRASVRKGIFPELKPSLKSISIRLPEDMLEDLKVLAHKKDVPYQSLAKIYLAREIQIECRTLKAGRSYCRRRPRKRGQKAGESNHFLKFIGWPLFLFILFYFASLHSYSDLSRFFITLYLCFGSSSLGSDTSQSFSFSSTQSTICSITFSRSCLSVPLLKPNPGTSYFFRMRSP